jgi:hypothetical protein
MRITQPMRDLLNILRAHSGERMSIRELCDERTLRDVYAALDQLCTAGLVTTWTEMPQRTVAGWSISVHGVEHLLTEKEVQGCVIGAAE